jgi:hypothetical protein
VCVVPIEGLDRVYQLDESVHDGETPGQNPNRTQ